MVPGERAPLTAPLVILGMEAGDADRIEKWAMAGHLPTIASIMGRGCWGRLSGPEMVSEHGVWVSLFSGVSRSHHGYYYWRPLKPGTYELELTDFERLSTLPFWSSLRGGTKKAAIIDPPESHPLPGLSGVQLANWAPHNPRFATCAVPEALLDDLRRRFGPPMYIEEAVDSSVVRDQSIYQGLLKQIEQKGELCRYLASRDRYDLILVNFFESHVAGHQFLKYSLPGGADSDESGLSTAIQEVYGAIDRQMGLLLAELPAGSNVFIVSNVGLHEEYPSQKLLENFCRQLGYQASAQPRSPRLGALKWSRRLMPGSWRDAAKSRLPRDVRERLRAEQFRRATNWRETTAFPIPALYTGFLRVNLRGREPEGTVESNREYENLLDRLEDDLRRLVDPEANQPAVRKISRTIELFGGGPPVSLPDLFVEWSPTPYIMRRVEHPEAVLVQEDLDFTRGSHHTHHGFVAAAGSSIRKTGRLGDLEVLDLAPTFLSLLDEPVRPHMSGKGIEEMVPL
ncbi:MAG TPA: alkaline phosphatase family protein [Gemmatimonadota bacterium]|nr:alkaline phosphatase family protein [Gemmatimonadota bacterium]